MNKRKNVLFMVVSLFFLLINEPYSFIFFFNLPSLSITGIIYLSFLIVLNSQNGKEALPRIVSVLMAFTSFVWLFYSIYFGDSSYITRIVLLAITYECLLYMHRTHFFSRCWFLYNRFILIQAALSIIALVLIFSNLLHPLITTQIQKNSGFYVNLSFWGLCSSKSSFDIITRCGGYFDEPGALAAWTVYGLVFNYAFLKDKIISKYLPWLCIVTFSVAYFFQMGIFLFLKNITRIYKLIPIVVVVALAIPYIEETAGSSFDINAMTLARLEMDSDKGIAGNNRQVLSDNAKEIFVKNPVMGIGSKGCDELDVGISDNPYEILVKDGIIGYIVSYLPLVFILLVNRKKEVIIGLIVVFAGYQQRPLHINFLHDLYIWSFLLFAYLDKKKILDYV